MSLFCDFVQTILYLIETSNLKAYSLHMQKVNDKSER